LARIEAQPGKPAAAPRIEGVSHEWHLREALKQLRRQQRLALEQFDGRHPMADDVAYVHGALPRDWPRTDGS
jgi:hypothetical protein